MKENEKNPRQLFQIFTTFMKIGIFTFGGGYAMIPLIQRETVVKRKWVDDDDILDIVAIAESTPGPIAINASTFVGYRVGGFFWSSCRNCWHDTSIIYNNTCDFFCVKQLSGCTGSKVCI